MTWRESILVGETDLDPAGVYAVVSALGGKYRGNAYHILQMNCNSFSDDLCLALTGRRIPGWVNRIATVALALHCLLPPGWVPPLKTPTGFSEDQGVGVGAAGRQGAAPSPAGGVPMLGSEDVPLLPAGAGLGVPVALPPGPEASAAEDERARLLGAADVSRGPAGMLSADRSAAASGAILPFSLPVPQAA